MSSESEECSPDDEKRDGEKAKEETSRETPEGQAPLENKVTPKETVDEAPAG